MHRSRLLDEVAAGEMIYNTKHGKRVAELRPADSPPTQAGEVRVRQGHSGE